MNLTSLSRPLTACFALLAFTSLGVDRAQGSERIAGLFHRAAPTVRNAAATSTAPFAPLDRPGPPLDVAPNALAASLTCSGDVGSARRSVVLLVPGTTLTPDVNFSWNYERAFTTNGMPWCAVTLPESAMADIQTAGEFVVNAIRTIARGSHRKVDILGYSQGGMVPRWALRFWPDTRGLVGNFVALDPSNHGTLDTIGACTVGGCAPAFWQQAVASNFYRALNSGTETFSGIAYTIVYSRTDEVVVPNLDASGSSSLHTGAGTIANIAVQQVCPFDTSEHLAMGTYDPVGYALAVDAFTHGSVASPARIPASVCLTPFQPGVDPFTFDTNYVNLLSHVATTIALTPHLATEPPLAPYVFPR